MTTVDRAAGSATPVEPGADEDSGLVAGAGPLSRLDALILEGVATGASSLQIACRLHLSRQAVDYHIKAMQRQFGAVNRAALVAKACVTGALEVGTWPPKVPPSVIRDHRNRGDHDGAPGRGREW
ncbi:helix-turn-helix domain-containing protein [Amycolatopsis sp. NPDC004747]